MKSLFLGFFKENHDYNIMFINILVTRSMFVHCISSVNNTCLVINFLSVQVYANKTDLKK